MMYHVPVLLKESIEGLSIKPKGTYLDLTFGGGGHSAKILEKLSDGGSYYLLIRMKMLSLKIILIIKKLS